MRSVVLIGPYGVGKSTIGHLLADSRGQRCYSLDECAWTYYLEIGLTPETAEALGDFASPRWQLYHAHAVKRFLQDHQHEICAMDLGAGHALYDGDYLEEMRAVLAVYDTILLIPSPDINISMDDLERRNNAHFHKRLQPHVQWNAFFLNHPSSYQLAAHVVYTKGKAPTETLKDILSLDKVPTRTF